MTPLLLLLFIASGFKGLTDYTDKIRTALAANKFNSANEELTKLSGFIQQREARLNKFSQAYEAAKAEAESTNQVSVIKQIADGFPTLATKPEKGSGIEYVEFNKKHRKQGALVTQQQEELDYLKKGHAALTNLVTGLSPAVKNTTQTTEAPVADSVQSQEPAVQTTAPTEEVAPVVSNETSIELPTGGFGVVDKAELEQVQANQGNEVSANFGENQQVPTATVMNGGTKSDNVIDQASLNERGDNRESPWLFADGKVVSSNGDHISLSDEYGYSGYRDMSKGTGAIRSTFYKPHNATDEQTPFVSLQLFDDQELTPEQFKTVESFVKANDAKITLGVDRSGNNTDNVEKNEISVDELKDKYTADQVNEVGTETTPQIPRQTTAPSFIDRLPDLQDYANEIVDGRSRLSNERLKEETCLS